MSWDGHRVVDQSGSDCEWMSFVECTYGESSGHDALDWPVLHFSVETTCNRRTGTDKGTEWNRKTVERHLYRLTDGI